MVMVAMNSMPIPGLAGGHALLALLGIRPEDRFSKVLLGATWVWGILVVCGLFWGATFLVR